MSAPKQVAKRHKLERKRRRKQATRLRRERERPREEQGRWWLPAWLRPATAPPGLGLGVKMSRVLEDFVAPLADACEGRDDYERLFRLAVVAWNAALEPPGSGAAMIRQALEGLLQGESPWERQRCGQIVARLVARKLESFSQYERPVLGFDLIDLPDGGLYLTVASATYC
jgi:hypothetical protein